MLTVVFLIVVAFSVLLHTPALLGFLLWSHVVLVVALKPTLGLKRVIGLQNVDVLVVSLSGLEDRTLGGHLRCKKIERLPLRRVLLGLVFFAISHLCLALISLGRQK